MTNETQAVVEWKENVYSVNIRRENYCLPYNKITALWRNFAVTHHMVSCQWNCSWETITIWENWHFVAHVMQIVCIFWWSYWCNFWFTTNALSCFYGIPHRLMVERRKEQKEAQRRHNNHATFETQMHDETDQSGERKVRIIPSKLSIM